MEYSELRFNKHYILWYQNVAKLLLTGKTSQGLNCNQLELHCFLFFLSAAVIPFLVLSYLNANVYIVIRRRRQHLGQRFMNPESNAYKAGTTDAPVQRLNAVITVFSEQTQ